MFSNKEIQKIHDNAKKKVRVSCCENHYHTADCLHGDPTSITICKLCEDLKNIRSQLQIIKDKIDGMKKNKLVRFKCKTDLVIEVIKLFPECRFDTNKFGEIIIYTNLKQTKKGTLRRFTSADIENAF